jgi:hypothetical protein
MGNLWVLFAAPFLANILVCAMDEWAMKGSFHMKNIGVSTRQVAFGKNKMYVTSAEGVLACLNYDTGEVLWRVVMDPNTAVEKMVASDKNLFSIDQGGKIARGWSSVDGSLLWETLLPLSQDNRPMVDEYPVAISADQDRVRVLALNSLFYLDSSSGDVSKSYSAPSGVVLSSLVISDSANDVADSNLRAAVGCKVGSKAISLADTKCLKPVIVETNAKTLASTIRELSKLPVSVLSLQVICSQNTGSFQTSDIMVGVTKGGAVGVLPLSATASFEVSAPSGGGSDASREVKLFTVGKGDQRAVAVSTCKEGGSDNKSQRCQTFRLDVATRALKPLVNCEGESSTVSSDVTSNSLQSSLVCASLKKDEDGQWIVAMKSVVAGSWGEFQEEKISIPQHLAFGSLQRVNFRMDVRGGIRSLVTSTSGLNIMSKDGKVLWVREEALATVRDAKIIDGTDATTDGVTNPAGALRFSFFERINMQLEEATSSLLSLNLEDIFWSCAAKVSNLVGVGGLQPNSKATHKVSRRFGFSKSIVMLASQTDVSPTKPSYASLSKAALKVIGLDSDRPHEPEWSIEPDLHQISRVCGCNAETEVLDFTVKLLDPRTVPGSSPTVILFLSMRAASGRAYSFGWLINVRTGEVVGQSPFDRSNAKATFVWVDAPFIDTVLEIPEEHDPTQQFMFAGVLPSGERHVVFTSVHARAKQIDRYLHHIDEETGVLQTARVTADCHNAANYIRCRCEPVASVSMKQDHEQIVAIISPNARDPLHSRAYVLGDDSLLLKYTNPNVRAVVTASEAVGSGAGAGEQERDSLIHVTVVDTVSGKVLFRSIHEDARAPVHGVFIENNLVISYWNDKAKRTELSSTLFFEGMVDKYGLGPFALSNGKHSKQSALASAPFSSFTSELPIAMQKTYVLPKALVGMHRAYSKSGISKKVLLLTLSNGQVYHFHRKMIDPRRPINPPLPREAAEGLYQYNAFLFLHPFTCLTSNHSLPIARNSGIAATATYLESTTLVLSYGLDLFLTRTAPSQGFDILPSDFNHPLLIIIIVGMAFAVYALKKMVKAKVLRESWT